jgi:hypothetical protein
MRPVSQINRRENCEFRMLTLAASFYAIDVIAHGDLDRGQNRISNTYETPRDPHTQYIDRAHTVVI